VGQPRQSRRRSGRKLVKAHSQLLGHVPFSIFGNDGPYLVLQLLRTALRVLKNQKKKKDKKTKPLKVDAIVIHMLHKTLGVALFDSTGTVLGRGEGAEEKK
jgi:hypothetical protein